jgi:hypothetical protein
VPNGFGMRHADPDGTLRTDGVNLNELIDGRKRDPISGCPETKYTLCRVERVA